ncbi:Histidinol-phosphate aminotransferase [Roseobacter fucihabitans]|uniref:Histidinol-phosphate aminotransferase n=1 Tax=Roseobacter fucihabitans TaxID=1537242 RepID=A0ABZ2BWQ6_9RHOB|nr:histidinol-phosphate transaminase [Roseobacter litoralis]MBC6964576.1 Histidinol-phosphate aminotransferase 2 [Roseobacter litoralis]
MSTALTPQPGIMDIALYQGGASQIEGRENPLKLSSNENPFATSPNAIAAIAKVTAEVHRYPSIDHLDLRAAIAEVHGLDPARLICGVGSDEILSLLAMAYAGPGDEVLYPEHGFSMYRIFALAAGATPVVAPEAGRRVDVDALIERITDATRLIYIANPANPTGTALDMAELTRLADAVPASCLLVLDGAYAEFFDGYDGGAALVSARDNVVMTRTFSKLYGLGGLRVGWGYAPQAVIDVLNRVRGPFNLSSVALAGAEAAVRDRAFVNMCLTENAEQRARLIGGLRQLGIGCDESQANFVLARFTDEDEAIKADAHLKAAGILVRLVKGYGFPDALRITVGRPEDVSRVLAALGSFGETT